ncbi:hypothetical protein OGAPHI_001463 [Ogataea philodendri]|uniref:Uncharacterized protein n=1 Tax=Ogataea philodendri TaxID=1378263 RepID=A0A9P8PDK6_9ASCO|nr:uncharacterized protein OGAPHI_001463 [Ogataea philodendri]KAH3669342.1 hypothetical protein OGAPHI_001463 [Ogataea philodendri]
MALSAFTLVTWFLATMSAFFSTLIAKYSPVSRSRPEEDDEGISVDRNKGEEIGVLDPEPELTLGCLACDLEFLCIELSGNIIPGDKGRRGELYEGDAARWIVFTDSSPETLITGVERASDAGDDVRVLNDPDIGSPSSIDIGPNSFVGLGD